MKRQYLNMNGSAWRQLRRNWSIPSTPMLLWQSWVTGPLLASAAQRQRSAARQTLSRANLSGTVVIVGYWRSGTTLLHELLSLDPRRWYPTTHACMNPQHFVLTEESALARGGAGVKRPMDEMEIFPGSPQEDEFALLSMGARSPYEALLAPSRLPQALLLGDPRDLPPEDQRMWRETFVEFMTGVSGRGGGRPLILKSPTHGYRVSTLREALPDARFVVIARHPASNFESVVRMWRRMFETYSLETIPAEDAIREAVLEDRPRYEAKLAAGIEGLPENRLAVMTYEQLVADPRGACEGLYRRLELGDYEPVRQAIEAEVEKRRDYRAQGREPSPAWRDRINSEWGAVFERYGYERR